MESCSFPVVMEPGVGSTPVLPSATPFVAGGAADCAPMAGIYRPVVRGRAEILVAWFDQSRVQLVHMAKEWQMFGSALYFPHIDIRDPVWLRSTLLFWDDIQTIAPSAVKTPYLNDDTRICAEAGLLRPLHCDMYPELIDDIGRKLLRTADSRSSFSSAIRQIDHQSNPTVSAARYAEHVGHEIEHAVIELTGMHPRRVPPELRELALRFGLARMHRGKVPPELKHVMNMLEYSRMHPEKLSYALRELMAKDYLEDEDGEWLLVDNQFASAYMAALAAKLANQLSLSPLTPEESAHGLSFRFLFDEVVDGSQAGAKGALLNLTLRGIRVDASVPIEKLIRFKEARKDQYMDFKSQINELSSSLENAEELDGEALLKKATAIHDQKVERGLRQFKRELEQNSISSAWEGAFTAATVSASSTTALAYFSGLTGPALIGVAASVSALSIGVKHYLSGRKLRMSNPYSYLHDVNQNFGLPDFT